MVDVADFVIEVLLSTVVQMLVLFGPLLVAGFLIAVFEKYSNKMLMTVFSFKAVIYSTGWLGTPVHETGHALFCLIFGHKIHEFKPFAPSEKEGGGYVLGYVKHSSKGNIWNNIGYLFIGTGPIILGSAVITLLIAIPAGGFSYFGQMLDQAPNTINIDSFLEMFKGVLEIVFDSVFSEGWGTFATWQFWVFFVVAAMIALHMSLSPPDLKSAWKGALFFLLILLIVNIVFVAFGWDSFTLHIASYLMFTTGILFIGVVLSFITMLLIMAFTGIISKLKG